MRRNLYESFETDVRNYKMVVLDASVVVKWFQKEEGSELALEFENRHITGEEVIFAPDLLFYEIANVFCFKKSIDTEIAESAFDILAKIGIQIFSVTPLEMKSILRFAKRYDITVYDALYTALAEKLECNFVTADKLI